MQSCHFFSRPINENFKFFKNCSTIFIKFWTVIQDPKEPLRAQKHQILYDWDVRNIAKISPKMDKK